MDIDLIEAHKHASFNQSEILKSSMCGCFSCMRIFNPKEIYDWTDPSDGRESEALCPYCGTDAVIGSASGYPIDNEFLAAMNTYWFSTFDPSRHGLSWN